MPVEVTDRNKFIELSSRAIECRVVRKKDITKVKARTKRYLYTIKIPLDEVDAFIKQLKCSNIKEISKSKEKSEK